MSQPLDALLPHPWPEPNKHRGIETKLFPQLLQAITFAFAVATRFRFRAAASLATRPAFSNTASPSIKVR
jgi:hypothetical protein